MDEEGGVLIAYSHKVEEITKRYGFGLRPKFFFQCPVVTLVSFSSNRITFNRTTKKFKKLKKFKSLKIQNPIKKKSKKILKMLKTIYKQNPTKPKQNPKSEKSIKYPTNCQKWS